MNLLKKLESQLDSGDLLKGEPVYKWLDLLNDDELKALYTLDQENLEEFLTIALLLYSIEMGVYVPLLDMSEEQIDSLHDIFDKLISFYISSKNGLIVLNDDISFTTVRDKSDISYDITDKGKAHFSAIGNG